MRPIAVVAARSCFTSMSFRKTLPETHQRLLRFMDDFQSFARNLEIAFRAAAAFRRWVANTGRNIAAILESIESRVNAANRDVVTAFRFEFFGYRNAVCFVAQPNENKHYHQFEIAQRCVSGCHIFVFYEYIDLACQSKRGKVRELSRRLIGFALATT